MKSRGIVLAVPGGLAAVAFVLALSTLGHDLAGVSGPVLRIGSGRASSQVFISPSSLPAQSHVAVSVPGKPLRAGRTRTITLPLRTPAARLSPAVSRLPAAVRPGQPDGRRSAAPAVSATAARITAWEGAAGSRR
jgi:hypothetical protein